MTSSVPGWRCMSRMSVGLGSGCPGYDWLDKSGRTLAISCNKSEGRSLLLECLYYKQVVGKQLSV
jgi:hypothetical protein